MKHVSFLQPLQYNFNKWLIVFLPFLLVGCASVNGINESPTRFGIGFQAMPGWQLGESNTSAHLLLGYSKINFKGGGGHNRILQAGVQVRQSFAKESTSGLWAGGEVSYLNIASVVKNAPGDDPKASGFTIGAIAGYRLQIGKVPLNFYFAPSYLKRGKFEVNNMSFGSGSSGFYAKVGVDVPLLSLLHPKGR